MIYQDKPGGRVTECAGVRIGCKRRHYCIPSIQSIISAKISPFLDVILARDLEET